MIRRILMGLALMALLAAPAEAAKVSQVWISEVLYDPAGPDSSNQKIELENRGATAVALGNWSICIQFNYKRFPTGSSIAAGGRYTIHINRIGANNPTNWYTGPYVNLDKASDGISLYHTFSGFGTAGNMEDYVGFGAGGQARENVAVSAGLWSTGAFVPLGLEGESVQFNPATSPPTLPHPVADYCNAAETIGLQNVCSVPMGGLADLRIAEVLADPAGPEAGETAVEVLNVGALPVDLEGLVLGVQSNHWTMPAGVLLAAGDVAVFRLNAAPAPGRPLGPERIDMDGAVAFRSDDGPAAAASFDVFVMPFVDLDPTGDSICLFANSDDFSDPANMLDFVQWGAAGQVGEGVADSAGLWTTGDYFPAALEGLSVQWRGTNHGASPDDFCADTPTLGAVNLCSTSGTPGGTGNRPVLLAGTPNPFSVSTTIRFSLPRAENRARLVLFDLAGRPVRTLFDGPASAGPAAVTWDGRDDAGRDVADGLYFYRLVTAGGVETRKLTLLR
jgi:hypothetical protein